MNFKDFFLHEILWEMKSQAGRFHTSHLSIEGPNVQSLVWDDGKGNL